MAIHIGDQRAGGRGLVVAGGCFILPAMLIVMVCAWAYATFGSLPQVQSVLHGVKPVIIAVVLQALWGLGRTAIKNGFLLAVGLLGTAAGIAGGNVLAILLAVGLVTVLHTWIKERRLSSNLLALPMSAKSLVAATPVLGCGPRKPVCTVPGFPEIWRGYLRKWLCLAGVSSGRSRRSVALVDSGTATRRGGCGSGDTGKVFTTATFIGYLLGGVRGAVVATAGIFLTGFLFVAASRHLIPRIRRSKIAAAFLDGVNCGAVALMIAVTWQLSRAALVDFPTAAIAVLSAGVLIYFRINSGWLIFASGLVGLFATRWLGA
jgi:chromate transporter